MTLMTGFFTVAISMASLVVLPLPGKASPKVSCSNAISEVRSDIQERLGGKVLFVEMNNDLRSPFPSAPQEIVVRIGSVLDDGISANQSRVGEDIVNSPILANRYSRTILTACPEAASVVFRWYEFNLGWFLHSDGSLRQIVCVEAGSHSRKKWGEMSCL